MSLKSDGKMYNSCVLYTASGSVEYNSTKWYVLILVIGLVCLKKYLRFYLLAGRYRRYEIDQRRNEERRSWRNGDGRSRRDDGRARWENEGQGGGGM